MADAPAAPVETTPPVVATAPVPAPAPPAQPATTTPAPAAPATPAAPDEVATLKANLEQMRAEARKHEDRWKDRDKQLEQQNTLLRTLAEKAGVEVDGKPDPEKLLQQVTSAQQAAADRTRELAIFRAAASANANPDLLLDSRGFMAKTADLDPSSSDFADRVKALVAETVVANPALAVTPAEPVTPPPATPPVLPASSGADFSGAPPGTGQWTEAMVAAASEEAVMKAMDQGLLRDLGFAPRRHGRNR